MNEITAKVVPNFLKQSEVKGLIADFESQFYGNRSKFHGGRTYLPNTDDDFIQLLEKSKAWKDLYQKLNSDDFLHYCLKELEVEFEQSVRFTKFFTEPVPNIFKKVHQLRARRIREVSFFGLSAYYAYLIYRYALFAFHRIKNFILNIKTVELLFDISSAENGYSREIHRDSDSRMIVFLLYFNPLEGAGEGGTLDLHKYVGNSPLDPPSRPKNEDCITIKSIKAEGGSLVIFKNDNFAFHSVPLMKGYDNNRLFCYGSFTITAGSNPFLNKQSKYKMKTQWRMWM